MTQDKTSLIDDFMQFRKERSPESRERLVGRICEHYTDQQFDDGEKQVIHEILSILAQDVEMKIRQVLSESLKESEEIPHELAMKLAADVEEVSVPILTSSTLLTDDDLKMLVKSTEEVSKLTAIAGRDNLSSGVSDELIDKNQEVVTERLLQNDTASISESGVNKIIDQHGESEEMMATLVGRGGLDVAVAERLISLVSDELQKDIAEKYDIDPAVAEEKVQKAREEMTLDIVSNKSRANVMDLVNHLHSTGKLTHSIVLRALCRADAAFFEASLSKLANIPVANARKLLREGSEKGFSALFGAAALPETMMEAASAVLDVIYSMEEEGVTAKPDFEKRAAHYLTEGIMARGLERSVPNMGYIMALIQAGKNESFEDLTA